MQIHDDIIDEMEQGNTPAIRWEHKQNGMSYFFNEGIYGSIMLENWIESDDVYEPWEPNYITKVLAGNTYKVQRMGKRSGMGLSFKVTSIEDKGDHALIHYKMVGQ